MKFKLEVYVLMVGGLFCAFMFFALYPSFVEVVGKKLAIALCIVSPAIVVASLNFAIFKGEVVRCLLCVIRRWI